MSQVQSFIHHGDNINNQIMDNLDEMIWALALPDLTPIYFNVAAVNLFQKSYEDLVVNPQLWLMVIDVEDQPKMQQAIAQAQETGKSKVTYRIQKRCFSANFKIFKNASGVPIRLDVISHEISEISDRQNPEPEHRNIINLYIEEFTLHNESSYRQIVQQQSDLILRSLADTTITFANEALCRMLGSDLAQIIGRKWIDFADPDGLQPVLNNISILSPEVSSFTAINRDLRAEGQIVWTQWINKGIFNEQGELVEIQSVGRDITALKSSELALKQLNEDLEIRIEQRTMELRQSEARNLAILHALPDLLLLLKPDGTCMQCIMPSNDHQSKYLPIQHHISEVLSADDLAVQLKLYAKAIATGEAQIYEHQISKFGKSVYEEVRIAPYCENELLVIVRDVTDRKYAEQQLQNVTDRLTIALKSAAIGIWEWNIANNLLVWDERTYELYAVEPDQSPDAYLAWASRVHPSDRQFAENEVQLALNGAKDYEPEFRIILPDGRIRYIKAYAIVQRNDEGIPQRMLGINFDITKRKLDEIQLQKSDTHLKTAQRIGKLGSWEFEINTGHLTWTDEVFHIYGLEPSSEPPTYEELKNYIHPDDWEHFNNTVQSAMILSKPYDLEHRVIQPSGKLIYVMAKGEMIYNSSGQLAYVIGTAIDITDRKIAEQTLQNLTDRLTLAVKSAAIGIWEWDISNNILIWDERMYELYGFSPPQSANNYLNWASRLHPEDRAIAESDVQLAIQGNKDFDCEFRILLDDHSIRYIKAYALIQDNGKSEPARMIGINFDITDRKIAEAQILQTAQQLEITNRELESFCYSVSHDLRAPLRHINGFVNALQQQLKKHESLDDPKVDHYLRVIDSSSQKMGHLIDGLLILSRYGRKPLESKLISIRELIDEAIEVICTDPQYNPLLEFTIGDLPHTTGDPTLLQQVFFNLISNAVKFSRNQPKPHIEISSLPDQTIQIKDNGVGFQMEYADKLFGAFQRLHNEKDFEGTGIGLAIVQRIIQRHGGNVWAESSPDQGATFFVKV